MSFQAAFVAIVLFLLVAPEQFKALGRQIIDGLMPIATQGLTLVIIIGGIMLIVGRFK